jgi:hypothetical protein
MKTKYYKCEYTVRLGENPIDRVTVICNSNCGPVSISSTLKLFEEKEDFAQVNFQPSSPLYNPTNQSSAGHVLLDLREDGFDRDVIVITFSNNSLVQGKISFEIAGNSYNTLESLVSDSINNLTPGESLACYVVMKRT